MGTFIGIAAVAYGVLLVLVVLLQRRLLYFPSRDADAAGLLRPWVVDGETWGACREVSEPAGIWLVTHGNAGQAAHRGYVVPLLPSDAAVFVLEYPGYGHRPGRPSRATIDASAVAAYAHLRSRFPDLPLGVLGESIGSGPAARLAQESPPPDAIVLAVPFDALADVAADALPWLPARALLRDRWDNAEALRGYAGRLDVFAAAEDDIIPAKHARSLAEKLSRARLHVLPCGHNDWSLHMPAIEPLR